MDGEEVGTVPVLEIEEGAFPVPFEVVALEVVYPIHPPTVEGDVVLLIGLAGVRHFTGHDALDLVDDKVRLKFLLGFRFADGYQFVDKAIDEDRMFG